MKTLQLTIFVLIFLFIISCQNKQQDIKIPEQIEKEIKDLASTPDSLLTPKQMDQKRSVYEIVTKSIKVEDNKFVNTSSPEDFEKHGLSKYYYYVLDKNIEEVNSNTDFNTKSAQELYDEMIQKYKPQINNR